MPEEAALTPEAFTTFGDLLRYLRRRATLRQRDFAEAADLSPSYVSRLEQNVRPPDVLLVRHKLVPALGLEYQTEWVARLLALVTEPAPPVAAAYALKPGDRPSAYYTAAAGHALVAGMPTEPLLTTKLHIPHTHPGSVIRSRLLAQLDQALTVPITLVAAPPGSGNTTLMVDWLSARTEEQGLRTESTASIRSVLSPQPSALVEPITSRELEVLRLIAAGHSNRAIARTLVIELGTVKRHVHSLLGKLGVQSRTQAIAQARTLGLLSDSF